ncbi:MAG: ATP-binding protein [Roseovarius sp.]|nr:ATP-binding protein [Roseovarius sp.]
MHSASTSNNPDLAADSDMVSRELDINTMRRRRNTTIAAITLVVLGPAFAFLTYIVMGPLDGDLDSNLLRGILLLDIIYIVVVVTSIILRLIQITKARRNSATGSRLHVRITTFFAFTAIIPSILIAAFATVSISMGLEEWFSERVKTAISASRNYAATYEKEHMDNLVEDANLILGSLYKVMDERGIRYHDIDPGDLREFLSWQQENIQRGLLTAFIVQENAGDGEDAGVQIVARGNYSYEFDLIEPDGEYFDDFPDEGYKITFEEDFNVLRILMRIKGSLNHYLYATRKIDSSLFRLVADTKNNASEYDSLETNRDSLLLNFGAIFIGVAIVVILATVVFGMWLAERMSGPLIKLMSAAQKVGDGNLDVQVDEKDTGDALGMLSKNFNQMTRDLKLQRQELEHNKNEIEMRERLLDSVLESVSSGVVLLDKNDGITFVNRAAKMRIRDSATRQREALIDSIPNFEALLKKSKNSQSGFEQDKAEVIRDGRIENLHVRISSRLASEGGIEGYVLAFDDVTELVSAQRMSAWEDMARQITHEINNPMTSIIVASDVIFSVVDEKLKAEDAEGIAELAGSFKNSINRLKRFIDGFSNYARMPKASKKTENLARILRETVILEQKGQPDVKFDLKIANDDVFSHVDSDMISQSLINIIKNAGESFETIHEKDVSENFAPQIKICCRKETGMAVIEISDNGVGFPKDRTVLFQPYFTKGKIKGTGLGLSIVKKLIEEHGGTIDLRDAAAFDDGGHRGAMVVVKLPLIEKKDETKIASA